MSEIALQNPLMQPVQYMGHNYFTSQYFHAQYKSNSNSNSSGKYKSLSEFNRLVRSIDTYESYIERGDIVEVSWQAVKAFSNTNIALLIKSNSYKPLMLISAVAQIALTHHLDDAISKQISVAVNTKAATKAVSTREIASAAKDMLALAKMFGLTGNQALLSASTATKKLVGSSPIELLGIELSSESKDRLMTVTEIGQQIGLSAQKTNILLQSRGLQDDYLDTQKNKSWKLTEKGKLFAELIDTTKRHIDGAPIQQIKWRDGVVDVLNGTA